MDKHSSFQKLLSTMHARNEEQEGISTGVHSFIEEHKEGEPQKDSPFSETLENARAIIDVLLKEHGTNVEKRNTLESEWQRLLQLAHWNERVIKLSIALQKETCLERKHYFQTQRGNLCIMIQIGINDQNKVLSQIENEKVINRKQE